MKLGQYSGTKREHI